MEHYKIQVLMVFFVTCTSLLQRNQAYVYIHTYIYITAKPKFENTLRYLRDYFNNAFSHVCLRLYTSEEIAFWLELLP